MKGAIKMPIQNPLFFHQLPNFAQILRRAPSASAWIKGSSEFPMISGNVSFFQTAIGVLVSVQITGLPSSERTCRNQFFCIAYVIILYHNNLHVRTHLRVIIDNL